MAEVSAEVEFDINEVVDGDHMVVTIRVTGIRRFNLRLSLALMLIRLAGWIAPVGLDASWAGPGAPEGPGHAQ